MKVLLKMVFRIWPKKKNGEKNFRNHFQTKFGANWNQKGLILTPKFVIWRGCHGPRKPNSSVYLLDYPWCSVTGYVWFLKISSFELKDFWKEVKNISNKFKKS